LIFDWDDTIFPSTFVDRHEADHFSDFPANVRRPVSGFAASVLERAPNASSIRHAFVFSRSERCNALEASVCFISVHLLTLPIILVASHRFAGTKIVE
jgi:hypothetical protein